MWSSVIGTIFDIIGYRGSLQDDLEDVPDNPLGYQNVGTGWGYGGIVAGHSSLPVEIMLAQKNSALINTTDTGETLASERNDTATPQNTV